MPLEIPERDLVRLLHMRDAAREVLGYAAGRLRQALDDDRMFRRAVVACVQEIGEAATRVTPEARAHFPSLPWNQIAGMRHRLVHAYFQIDLDLVWDVVTKDIGPLLSALEPALPEDPTQPAP